MLVRRDSEQALAIGQLSHSWLSGQLARAWGNEQFTAPHPREEIALGAEQHDIGWARVDLQPRLSAETGLPRSFVETSVGEHLQIWRDAPDMLVTQSLHAALVVSLHGRSLSQLRLTRAGDEDRPALEAHIEAERTREARLCRALGLDEQAARTIGRQMWAWDGLSLALCNGWAPFTARDVPASAGLVDVELSAGGDGVHTLAPWPLREDRVVVRCEARRLAPSYADEDQMRSALAQARPETLEFVLVAP